MIGKQILNYKIESLLGEGGMGSVYLAVHTQLGRKVAIKALNPSLVKNLGIRTRFKNEASTLSHLHHPSIVILFDYLEEENGLYLIMEYVEGKTLDEYIETVSGPIPESRAIPLFTQVLDAFTYAHEQGVIHRDVKPANIMVTGRDRIKILDFGIAKLLVQKMHTLTQAGTKMGTVLYMSPEQVKGELVDKRSDIYSLGVTLFQMLTGKSPYSDPDATEFAVYNKIVNEPLPEAKSLYPGVSARMQAILDKATAKIPSERFQDCQEFKDALLGNTALPLSGTVAGTVSTGLEEQIFETKNTQSKTAKTNITKKYNLGSLIRGLIVSLIIILGVVYLVKNNKKEDEANTNVVNQETPAKESVKKKQKKQKDESTATEPEVITEDNEPSDSETSGQKAEALQYIKLFYEPANEEEVDESDTLQRVDTKFTVRIILTNESPDISFDNVTIKITYFNENNNVLGNYIYDHGRLEAGQEEKFLVDRKVRASRVECAIASAELIESAQEEIQE